ncbi:hypothetical protein E3N88_23263 [Mikania micrantha]|uniref:Uncharacterized protein n=1 Tax=Mikania micrantha TaxID=192012 RepID=A0A5N6NCV2_9ASTR|nr:hypothetical protein E3N88_23263 [Mikania micrantha]
MVLTSGNPTSLPASFMACELLNQPLSQQPTASFLVDSTVLPSKTIMAVLREQVVPEAMNDGGQLVVLSFPFFPFFSHARTHRLVMATCSYEDQTTPMAPAVATTDC